LAGVILFFFLRRRRQQDAITSIPLQPGKPELAPPMAGPAHIPQAYPVAGGHAAAEAQPNTAAPAAARETKQQPAVYEQQPYSPSPPYTSPTYGGAVPQQPVSPPLGAPYSPQHSYTGTYDSSVAGAGAQRFSNQYTGSSTQQTNLTNQHLNQYSELDIHKGDGQAHELS
jgi:hypothetical protein